MDLSVRILVTGINGFVGRRLAQRLVQAGHDTVGVIRHGKEATLPADLAGIELHTVEDIATEPDWAAALAGVDVVVHLAARVHQMRDKAGDSLALYRETNAVGTRRLAEAAAATGVKRFIYLSSIKVNGEASDATGFRADDAPSPQDDYAVSKWEAEQALRQCCESQSMDFVIIRPPLVYGPGVRGNLARLIRWVDLGVPLPLGSIDNRRSMVSLDNLVSFIVASLDSRSIANQVLLIADDFAWSTPQLVRRIAHHLDRPSRLLPARPALLRRVASTAGKGALIDRLCGSLCVDDRRSRELLGWSPPQAADEGVREAVAAYRADTTQAGASR